MVDVSDDLAVKELTASKMWVPCKNSGDETNADITFSGSQTTAVGLKEIIIGRTSNTSANNTILRGRNRNNTGGWVFDGSGLTIVTGSAPLIAPNGSILNLSSTTQGMVLTNLTTTQRNSILYSGAGTLIFNTTTGKLNIATGSGWEVVTSA